MEEQELEQSTNVATETEVKQDTGLERKAEDLPRLEDLVKSEKEIRTAQKIEGVSAVQAETQPQDRIFKKKNDERKVYIKKRLKIVTAVYSTVVALLLGFVITNLVIQSSLNKQITTNTKTIQSQTQVVEEIEGQPGNPLEDFTISVNEPRDYSEDKKELTFLDKLTIIFRNLFA